MNSYISFTFTFTSQRTLYLYTRSFNENLTDANLYTMQINSRMIVVKLYK